MSSKNRTSSTSNSSKARHRDGASVKATGTSEQSSVARSHKVINNQREASDGGSTSTVRNDKTSKSRSSSSNKRGVSRSKQKALHKNKPEDESRELVTTTGRGSVEKLIPSSDDTMDCCKEQETNVDGVVGPSILRNGSDSDEKESDESSCLLLSESQSSEKTPVKPDLDRTTDGTTPTNDDLNINTNDSSVTLPIGWEQHRDKLGLYYWHVSTGVIQRNKPTSELEPRKESILVCHDDEEINQITLKSSDSDDDDYFESGAALTLDDTSETTFVVYPLGCCEFDEIQLVQPANSTKAIQKCILRLCNMPTAEESICWGLDQSQPILMKLHSNYIQFTDMKTRNLLRSQPINTIRTWAVDDDNNFAFVIEDRAEYSASSTSDQYESSVDYALLSEPRMMCYVFRSMDDDDMSCKVAAKLNEEISRYKELLSTRMAKSTQLQQMIEPTVASNTTTADQLTDTEEDFECLETNNELTIPIKYIGSTPVPRPTGIDVLNAAIDKCLAEARERAESQRCCTPDPDCPNGPPYSEGEYIRMLNSMLIDAKLHVSPSSVIVESCSDGEIIVECRIRYLTFICISRRDIRWFGFIMQNSTNKSFVAYCFECHPTAGPVCDAIQQSCTKMYEKVIKNSSKRTPETMSIIPTKSKIRNTLAKTFARIKLNPITN